MSRYEIRPAHESDLDAIMQIEVEAFGSTAWPIESMQTELAPSSNRRYLVAELNNSIVAYAGCSAIEKSHADVMTIAVAPPHRGQGLGERLMGHLIGFAREKQCTEMFLEVRADNAAAQNLYEKLGFLRIDLRRGYYQPEGIDAVIMKLKLNADARAAEALGDNR
jgi:ribosomal-protein-alanine acetyltransferase